MDEHEQRAIFLQTLSETANITESAKKAVVPRRTIYNWRNADPAFAAAWDEAAKIGTDALEDEAARRASKGWQEPVYYKGERVGAVRKFSDTLLIFLLKARNPDKFKDRSETAHTGPGGGPVVTEIVIEHHTAPVGEAVSGSDGGETPPADAPRPVESVAQPSEVPADPGRDSLGENVVVPVVAAPRNQRPWVG